MTSSSPSTIRGELYPPSGPSASGMLPVSDGHTLYWEESGDPDGIPVLFLHGGPGSGCHSRQRRYFNAKLYRVILFDQRGAGKSTPRASISHNTTPHLVADIEKLRAHLNINRCLLFGGSWGSTLALAYAQDYPDRVIGMILRGIFLGRDCEVDWFLHGMKRFFPEAAERFLALLPVPERADPLENYYRRLIEEDANIHLPAAHRWCDYERNCSVLLPGDAMISSAHPDQQSRSTAPLAVSRIEAHYFRNHCFFQPNQLLDRIGRIAGIPSIIVQGRYDVVCPPISAMRLHQNWPESKLLMVRDGGHMASEPGIQTALIAASDQMAELLAPPLLALQQ